PVREQEPTVLMSDDCVCGDAHVHDDTIPIDRPGPLRRVESRRRHTVSSQPASEDHAAGAVRRRARWSELGWTAVLLAIGIVQVIRQQWFDAAIYGFMVAMIAADAFGLLADRTRTRFRP